MEIVKWGIVVTGILLLRKAAWGRISRRMQYGIWIVTVLLFMVQPFIPVQSSFSIENLFSESIIFREQNGTSMNTGITGIAPIKADSEAQDTALMGQDREETQVPLQGERTETDTILQSTAPFLYQWIHTYGSAIRWGASLLLGLGMLLSNLRFYRYCRRERIFYKRDPHTGLQIYVLKELPSPFLAGNRIYVDARMVQDEKKLSYMILHEYCHYRNGDLLWVLLRNLCLVLYFYNPFVWVAVRYMKQDCELACDEAVLQMLQEEAQRKEYGYTLLALAGRQNHKAVDLTITTSMSGGAKRLKERIGMISRQKKISGMVSVLVLLILFCLAGCTFTDRKTVSQNVSEIKSVPDDRQGDSMNEVIPGVPNSEEENREKEDEKQKVQNKDGSDQVDSTYNVVKWADGYFYFPDAEGLKRVSEETAEVEKLAEGNVKLGNFDGDFLYYIRYPVEKESLTGLIRMSIKNRQEEQLAAWSEELWTCRNIYACEEEIYIELADSCEEYMQKGDHVEKVPEDQQMVYQILERCGYSKEDAAMLPAGYTNAIFQYHKLVCREPAQNRIFVYDTDTGNRVKEITDTQSDVLLSNRGVVYKDLAENIYLQSWNGETAELLYEAGAHDQESVNYGTYDEEFLYGFVEEETQCTLIKLSWEGGYERSKTFTGVEKAVQLGFSVNHGVAGYWQNGQIIFEKV